MKYIREHKTDIDSKPEDPKVKAKREKITFIDKIVISELTVDGKEKNPTKAE